MIEIMVLCRASLFASGAELSLDTCKRKPPPNWQIVHLDGADVALRPDRTHDPALVMAADWIGLAGGVVSSVDRRACQVRFHRERGSTVVLQGAEHRIGVDVGT